MFTQGNPVRHHCSQVRFFAIYYECTNICWKVKILTQPPIQWDHGSFGFDDQPGRHEGALGQDGGRLQQVGSLGQNCVNAYLQSHPTRCQFCHLQGWWPSHSRRLRSGWRPHCPYEGRHQTQPDAGESPWVVDMWNKHSLSSDPWGHPSVCSRWPVCQHCPWQLLHPGR